MTTPTPSPDPGGAAGEVARRIAECQRRLSDASRRYLDGEITVEEFEVVEEQCLPDYRGAVADLIAAREAYRKMSAPKGTRLGRWVAHWLTAPDAEGERG